MFSNRTPGVGYYNTHEPIVMNFIHENTPVEVEFEDLIPKRTLKDIKIEKFEDFEIKDKTGTFYSSEATIDRYDTRSLLISFCLSLLMWITNSIFNTKKINPPPLYVLYVMFFFNILTTTMLYFKVL